MRRSSRVAAAPASPVAEEIGAPGPIGAWSRGSLGLVLVAVAVVLCFANTLQGAFVFDDHSLVVGNETIRSARFIPRIFSTNLWDFFGRATSYYRPVPPLFLMAVHAAFGLQPAAFHAVNVVLHAASACLVFAVARRLAHSAGLDGARAAGSGLVAALLFALHPVNSESVAWIAGMVDVVGTFFSLLALYAYVRADPGPPGRAWYAIALVALLLAFLSKEPALAMAPVLVAYDVLCRRDAVRTAGLAARRWGPIAATVAVYLAMRIQALGGLAPFRYGPPGRIADAPVLLARYLEKLVLPLDLSAVHDIPPVTSLLSADALRTAVVLAAFLALALLAARAGRAQAIALLLVVLPLAPVLVGQTMNGPEGLANRFAERHLYLSSAGAAFWAVAGILLAARRSRTAYRATIAAALVVTLAFAATTFARNRVWRDDVSLWSDTARKAPGVAVVHLKLGLALLRGGDLEDATREIREAARLDPMIIRQNLAKGIEASARGRFDAAVDYLLVPALGAPQFAEGRFQLAVALEGMGNVEGAAEEYEAALARDPGHDAARHRLDSLRAREVERRRAQETAPGTPPQDR